MASYFPDHEARLRAQEALTSMIHAQVHGVSQVASDKADKSEVADLKAAMEKGFAELSQLLKAGLENVEKQSVEQFAGMDKRLDWQDGQFAELRASLADLSNRVAGIVSREKGPYSSEESK